MSAQHLSTDTPQQAPALRRPRKRLLLLVVIPLLAGLVGSVMFLRGGRVVETENAYVKADKLPVSAEVSGKIREVLVGENMQVKAGQPLFRLDEAPFLVAVAKAEAKVAQVRTDLAALRAAYREKQAEIRLARTRLTFAKKEQQRQQGLATQNFISSAKYEDAQQGAVLAEQQVEALKQDLHRIAESLGGSVDAPVTLHPAYLSAQAELAQARLDLARAEVRAPLAGIVSKAPKIGQFIGAGSTALALVATDTQWIEANFPEGDLTYVQPGQPVTIHVDTYPDSIWHGEVDSLSPATGAEFSLIPAQNATGNWVKIAQRVPVRIRIAANPALPALRAGLSTEVAIDTGHRRRLFGLSL